MASLGTFKKSEIESRGNRIADAFNASQILNIPVVFQVIKNDQNMLAVRFALNEETYSGASYFLEVSGFYKGHLAASGIGVNSNLGNRTGTLLFHLTLLLVISSNAAIFYLDNFTDDPARAAQGIYELLDVDKTIARHGTDRSEFAGLNLEDQLHLSEGGMRLIIDASTHKRWKQKFLKIGLKAQNQNLPSPWIQPAEKSMQRFVTQISKFQGFSGGRKIRRKRHFSQKTTTKSGKSKKKSKKKAKTKIEFSIFKIRIPLIPFENFSERSLIFRRILPILANNLE